MPGLFDAVHQRLSRSVVGFRARVRNRQNGDIDHFGFYFVIHQYFSIIYKLKNPHFELIGF